MMINFKCFFVCIICCFTILIFHSPISYAQPDTIELVKNRMANVQMQLRRVPELDRQIQNGAQQLNSYTNLINDLNLTLHRTRNSSSSNTLGRIVLGTDYLNNTPKNLLGIDGLKIEELSK